MHELKIILLTLLFVMTGCKDIIFLNTTDEKELLVVDGLIINEPGPYTVKLSLSATVKEPIKKPYRNCIVSIIDIMGNTEVLTEKEAGIYQTLAGGIQAVVGNEYKITILTPEGKQYETAFQELRERIEIDSVYVEFEYKPLLGLASGLPGYHFYADTKEAPFQESYFLWTVTETYEYDVDFELAYVENRFGDIMIYNPRYDTLSTCWKTEDVKKVFTGSNEKLSTSQIIKQPIHFVGTDTKKLTKRYTALINQFTIGEEAYKYWQAVEKQTSNENFLVTSQPVNIKGNVSNVSETEEEVLGFFTVASVSSKRIFVDQLDVPFYYSTCLILKDPWEIREWKKTHGAPYFYVDYMYGVGLLISQKCIDCRSEGGSLTKPEFWIDN